jgi:RHS repeat-associated protein
VPFGFGAQWGYYTDSETNLVLLTNRYYDPARGRFLTRDPAGYGGGINLYGYVGNGPLSAIDPSGPGGQDEGEKLIGLSVAIESVTSFAGSSSQPALAGFVPCRQEVSAPGTAPDSRDPLSGGGRAALWHRSSRWAGVPPCGTCRGATLESGPERAADRCLLPSRAERDCPILESHPSKSSSTSTSTSRRPALNA